MFNSFFRFGRRGGALPPVYDKLLAWSKGGTIAGDLIEWGDDTIEWGDDELDWGYHRRDYALTLGNFPMRMSASHCVTLASGETGTTNTDHGPIVSSSGTAVLTYTGATIAVTTPGTLFNITFTDGTHYRMAEGESLQSFSDNYETEGYYIAWTADPSTIWLGTQDGYHGNVIGGFGYGFNYLKYSEDFLSSGWDEFDVAVVDEGEYATVTRDDPGNDGSRMQQSFTAGAETLCATVRLKQVTSSTPRLLLYNVTTATSLGFADITLTSEFVDYSVTASGTIVIGDTVRLYIYVNGSGGVAGNAYAIERAQADDCSEPEYFETQAVAFTGAEKLPFLTDHAPNTWNQAETLYAYPELAAIIAADALGTGPHFFDGSGNEVPQSEAEMVAQAAASDSFFFCQRNDVWQVRKYNEELAGQELIEADGYCLTSSNTETLVDGDGNVLVDAAGNVLVNRI